MTDDEAGRLFKAIVYFQTGDEIELDRMTKFIFAPFKNQFERDEENYQKTVERNRNNGSKGGRPNNREEPSGLIENPKKPSGLFGLQEKPKKADSKKDSDNDSKNDNDSVLIQKFESFRKLYGGTKNGHDTEFKNLQKHKDWREVIPILEDKYRKELEWRSKSQAAGVFVPHFANLQTWINQRRWEMEMPELPEPKVETPKGATEGLGYDDTKPGIGKVYNSTTGKFRYPKDYVGPRV